MLPAWVPPIIVDNDRLNAARVEALARINAARLSTVGLEPVRVRLGFVPTARGEYWFEERVIWIPVVCFTRTRTGPNSLVETLIHEYGHAVACQKAEEPRFSKIFRREFGRKFAQGNQAKYAPQRHVSRYAATDAMEDFAETFLAVVRHGRREPSDDTPSCILRKMAFVIAVSRDACTGDV
jgi:hypothetical protein